MLKSYLLIAVRHLLRDRVYSVINIAGLAVGIACFLTLFLYVQDELNHDTMTGGADRHDLYRVIVKTHIQGHEETNSKTSGRLGPQLIADFPEVESFTRIGYYGPRAFIHGEKVFRSGSIYAVDSTFFQVFPLRFLEGNPLTALTQPHSLVLTERGAKRIFGDVSPLGKTLHTESGQDFLVTGLTEDFPDNSHFKCDYLESLTTYDVNENWLDLWYTTYVELKPGTEARDFEAKLGKVVVEQVGPAAQQVLGVPIEQFMRSGNSYAFVLQPFSSIYLHSKRTFGIDPNTEWGNIVTSDIAYTYISLATSFFILLLAVINFMNLSTAKSERRAREVGVRKTFGSDRSSLVIQFIGESIIMSGIAMLLGLLIVAGVLPFFNALIDRDLTLTIVNDIYTIPLLIGFVIFVGALSGSYPAFFLSSARPAQVLKGSGTTRRKSRLRSALVIAQFAISICLLIGTVVMNQQLNFIQEKSLGFNKEHLLSISNANLLGERWRVFKEEVQKDPAVNSITKVSRMFAAGIPGSGYLFEQRAGTDPLLCQIVDVDYDFLKTFQIDLVEGRFFSKDFPTDSSAVIVNEAALATFYTDNVLGKELFSLDARDSGRPYTIIGVIKNFNYESLHREVRPLVLHLRTSAQLASALTMRINASEMPETIARIESKWKEFVPADAMDFTFVDQTIERLYEAERKSNLISGTFSFLAIFIACIGLFGLAAFVTEQRTREIGIRKVMGATSFEVVVLLSREFAVWVVISNLLAWPVAYFVMQDWLNNFAFHIDLSLLSFLAAGLATLTFAFITVGVHALKAAETNPTISLKYE